MPILCAASCKYLSIDSNLYVNVIYISVWITFCSLQHFAPSKNIICRNLVVLFGPNSTFIIRIKTNTAHTILLNSLKESQQWKQEKSVIEWVGCWQTNSFDFANITEMNKHAKITQYSTWKKQLKYSSCWHRICLRCSRFALKHTPFSRYPARAGTNTESQMDKQWEGWRDSKILPLEPWHLC